MLRSRPLAAGLDPRFTVLDGGGREPPGRRRPTNARWRRGWRALGRPAVDLAAAYAASLRDIVLGAHDDAAQPRRASRGWRSRPSARRPRPAALAAVRARRGPRARGRRRRHPGERGPQRARRPASGCSRRAGCRAPASAGSRPSSARARRRSRRSACEAYRDAWEAYRGACADHHARAALILIDELLARFAAEYAGAKAERAGVDFEDLELGVRALLAGDAERRALERALRAAHGRRVPGHQPAAARPAGGARAREPVRGRRRVPVDLPLPPRRRRHLPRAPGAPGRRSRPRSAGQLPLRARAAGRARRRLRARVRRGLPAARGGPRARRRPPGRRSEELRLFDPDPPGGRRRPSSCSSPTRAAGTSTPRSSASPRWPTSRGGARRRALVAHRLREEVARGPATGRRRRARARDGVAAVVRAGARGAGPADLRRRRSRLLVPGAGPRRARLPRRARQPARRDGASTACSRRRSAASGSDALVLLAQAGREGGRGPWAALRAATVGAAAAGDPAAGGEKGGGAAAPGAWLDAVPAEDRERLERFAARFAAERARAQRLPPEALLERAISASGYDLAILARAGGERRLANLRKLMRLAREYEHAEGRDLRGFLAFAATQDLAEAREGEARAGVRRPRRGAADDDPPREGARVPRRLRRRPRAPRRRRPATAADRPRRRPPGCGWPRSAAATRSPRSPTSGWPSEEDRADAEEERRLFYVAMTRARETLILSGGADAERWPQPRPGGAPLDWIVRAVAGEPRELFAHAAERVLERSWEGRGARVRCALSSPATLGEVLPRGALAPAAGPRPGAPATALPKAPKVMPAPPARARPAPQRLSYSALRAYARCGYRFYLQRVLGLARRAGAAAAGRRGARRPRPAGARARSRTPCSSRWTSHVPSRRPARTSRRWPPATASMLTRCGRRGPARDRGRVRPPPRCANGSRPRARCAARRASRSRSSRAAAARS